MKKYLAKIFIKWFAPQLLEIALEALSEKDARQTIHNILLKYFVPMDKWKRHYWESFLINCKDFPYGKLISEVWHTEIKAKYPNIGEWPK